MHATHFREITENHRASPSTEKWHVDKQLPDFSGLPKWRHFKAEFLFFYGSQTRDTSSVGNLLVTIDAGETLPRILRKSQR